MYLEEAACADQEHGSIHIVLGVGCCDGSQQAADGQGHDASQQEFFLHNSHPNVNSDHGLMIRKATSAVEARKAEIDDYMKDCVKSSHLLCCSLTIAPAASVQKPEESVQEDCVADLRHHALDQTVQGNASLGVFGCHAEEVASNIKAEHKYKSRAASECHMVLKLSFNACDRISKLWCCCVQVPASKARSAEVVTCGPKS